MAAGFQLLPFMISDEQTHIQELGVRRIERAREERSMKANQTSVR